MTFEQLLYVVELARNNSLGETADILHVSKSGLSTAVSNLEEELGLPLFERNHDGTTLTDNGKLLIPNIEAILNQQTDLRKNALQLSNHNFQRIDIEYSNTMINSIISKYVELFSRNSHEDASLNINCDATSDIISKVENLSIDAGLILINNQNLQDLSNLKFDVIHTSRVKLVVSKQNPISKLNEIHLEDLKKQTFAKFTDKYNSQIFDQLQYLCGPLNEVLQSDDGSIIFEAIKKMNLVCLARDWQGRNSSRFDMTDLKYMNIGNLVNDEFSVGWITSPEKNLSTLTNEFMNSVSEDIRSN
jgi:DNA-binding transcriptional LysR family regulator